MRNIQEIFNDIQELKLEQKEIRSEYKDALSNANDYEETLEEIKKFREKKKQIESAIQNNLGSRYKRFEEIQNKLKELEEMLTDVAMTTIMDGKSISLKDKQEHEYEPVYKVTFRKLS